MHTVRIISHAVDRAERKRLIKCIALQHVARSRVTQPDDMQSRSESVFDFDTCGLPRQVKVIDLDYDPLDPPTADDIVFASIPEGEGYVTDDKVIKAKMAWARRVTHVAARGWWMTAGERTDCKSYQSNTVDDINPKRPVAQWRFLIEKRFGLDGAVQSTRSLFEPVTVSAPVVPVTVPVAKPIPFAVFAPVTTPTPSAVAAAGHAGTCCTGTWPPMTITFPPGVKIASAVDADGALTITFA